MPEHAWIHENLAGYCAGGLDAAERERFEQHTAACESCAKALAEALALDHTLHALFEPARPAANLEDRMIQLLRTAPSRQISLTLRAVLAVAAVLLVGVLGAGMGALALDGDLPFPGMAVSWQLAEAKNSNVDRVRAAVLDQEPAKKVAMSADELAEGLRSKAVADLERLGDVAESRVEGREAKDRPTASTTGLPSALSIPGTPDNGARLESVPGYNAPVATSGKDQNAAILWDRNEALDLSAARGWGFRGASPSGGGSPLPMNIPQGNTNGVLPYSPPAQGLIVKGASPVHTNSELFTHYSYRNDATAPVGGPGSAVAAISVDGRAPTGAGGPGGAPGEKVLAATQDKASGAKTATADDHFKPGQLAQTPPVDPQAEAKPKAEPQADSSRGKASGPGKEDAKPGELNNTKEVPKPGDPAPTASRRIIIRSGDIEFEVESFDSAVAAITKLVTSYKGGFVATVNSEKLPNGKVRGSVVVRLPPEHLDSLVLDLRRDLGKGGELKGQRIGSQDVTKQYTDTQSRLRAARAMEERLLAIIKSGKGEIKDLLNAEKELGIWRTKIEEYEGEIRYYDNLAALSTLTISLSEKEIRAPFALLETERINMGLEVEDVDKAYREALAAITEAKGRITKAELKQYTAGQYSAVLHFEVAPDAAGPLRDRLKQLGTVARLDIDRAQQAEGGTGKPQDAKIKRADTQFFLSIYNLANVAPRETVHLNLASVDAEEAYKKVLARVEKAGGRILSSNFNRQGGEQSRGDVAFEVKSAEADAVLLDLKTLGEVLRLQTTENPDTQNVTRSKRGFKLQVWAMGLVTPRETVVIRLAARDVPAGYRALQDAVAKAKGRMLNAQLNEQDRQNVSGQLDFDFRRADETTLTAALTAAGDIFSRTVTRAPDSENVIDSKVLWRVTLVNLANIPPRETTTLGIEVTNVETTASAFTALVAESKGRTVEAHVAHERSGRVTAKLVFDVPLATAPGLVEKFNGAGTVRVQQSSRNPQVPDSDLAVARLDVTLSNAELIVPSDEGLGAQLRKSLGWSFKVLSWSLSWVIVGLCAVGPWALVAYGVYRLVLRLRRRPGPATAA